MAVGSELDVNIKAAVASETNCLQDNEENYGQSDVCATSDCVSIAVNNKTTHRDVTDTNRSLFHRNNSAGSELAGTN